MITLLADPDDHHRATAETPRRSACAESCACRNAPRARGDFRRVASWLDEMSEAIADATLELDAEQWQAVWMLGAAAGLRAAADREDDETPNLGDRGRS